MGIPVSLSEPVHDPDASGIGRLGDTGEPGAQDSHAAVHPGGGDNYAEGNPSTIGFTEPIAGSIPAHTGEPRESDFVELLA